MIIHNKLVKFAAIAERYVHLNEELEREKRQEADESTSPALKVKKVSF
jgi:hypothetical protein